MNGSNLGQDLGRIFEVGFNIGMLTYLKQKEIQCNYGDCYQKDLQQINFPKIVRRLIDNEGVINPKNRQTIRQWTTFFLQKSFLAGLNFLEEYFTAIGWDKSRKLQKLEVVYYQCKFADDNSIGTYYKGEKKVYEDWFSQFGFEIHQVNTHHHSQKGEFLNADSLIYFRQKNQVRILTIDYSIFSIKSIRDLADLNNIEVLRQILLSNISYLKSKSVFANLGLDSQTNQFFISDSLSQYYKAFAYKDKETIKMIQAGSYGYSFWNWLNSQQLLSENDDVTFNIIGYSDRDIASLCLRLDNIQILETCHQVYQQQPKKSEIKLVRERVLTVIKRKAKRSFINGEALTEKLLKISRDGIHLVSHQENFTDFNSYLDPIPSHLANSLGIPENLNLQQAHAELIQQALSSKDDSSYIFLTGNPGIGKTTAISNFLKQDNILDEGFLFFYISPRTQVNLDIIEKFKQNDCLCDNRIMILNSNANLIEKNDGKLTVQYCSNLRQDIFHQQGVDFIPQGQAIESKSNAKNDVTRQTATRVKTSEHYRKGVLYSISEAIYSLINTEQHHIVATVALQSLKKLNDGTSTLKHFKRIFRDIYNETEGKAIAGKLKQLSQKIKHIFIAIDEITGDHSGVNFLLDISEQLNRYGLMNKDYFNTKVIVADASIIDSGVIQKHLSKTTVEPNKIFFRKAKSHHAPLTQERFGFNQKPAVTINTNSYPAKTLQITYKTFIHSLKFRDRNKKVYSTRKYDLEQEVNNRILKDVNEINIHSPNEQIIIYIQDKLRLGELIDLFRQQRNSFKKYQDYLEIHADLSDPEKQQVHQFKNQVQIIFMTASASRGLSFPFVQHILVDLPRFEIEANLMEVIQVIYRGRGNQEVDLKEKQLIFYLTEQAVYYGEDAEERQFSIQESKLNILNFLIILHLSIKTRIYGHGNIANQEYMMIPIGGKSVFSAGESLSYKMKVLMTRLKKEYHRYRHDLRFQQAYQYLEEFMNTAEITIYDPTKNRENNQISYLRLIEEIRQFFVNKIEGNLETLLDFPAIQTGYVTGSVLLVPLGDKRVEEVYHLKIDDKVITLEEILLELQKESRLSENLQHSIQDCLQFIDKLKEQPEQNQRLEQDSQYLDQYYAIPLFVFVVSDVFDRYFKYKEQEPKDQRFRDLLDSYIRSFFPISQALPIGYQYEQFPFIIFRSYSLKEIRDKRFSAQYLINSKELNVLSLILAQSEDE